MCRIYLVGVVWHNQGDELLTPYSHYLEIRQLHIHTQIHLSQTVIIELYVMVTSHA